MRNLKKILALVLALVMSLSLMATAGASSFSDVDDSNPYSTAIDVLDALKVFIGYEDGSFQPTGELTRAEAAVLVYRIATGDVEGQYVENYTYMANSKFNDLDNGYGWAKGYINYCQNAEIIKGTSATTFSPGLKVTGYQLMVMVLRTLGYDKAGEFSDPITWELESARKCEQLGMLKNIPNTGDFGNAASRQMTAEILFRGLLQDTVNYSVMTPGGYTSTGKTLGYEKFTLEEVTGVVVANEYADLHRDPDLAGHSVAAPAGTTVLDVDGEKFNISVSSTLEDLGETRTTYTVENGKANGHDLTGIALVDTGKNDIAYDGGEAVADITKSYVHGSTASRYLNFGEVKGDDKATIKITYQAERIVDHFSAVSTAAAKTAFCKKYNLNETTIADSQLTITSSYAGSGYYQVVYTPAGDDEFVTTSTNKHIYADGNKHVFSIVENARMGVGTVNERTATVYRVEMEPDSKYTDFDESMVNSIFYRGSWTAGTEVTGLYVTGEVYRGTQVWTDYSDANAYGTFLENSVKAAEEHLNNKINSNSLGWWLKVIDNDSDGITDYVLQTRYTVAKVTKVADDGTLTLDTWNGTTLMNNTSDNDNPVNKPSNSGNITANNYDGTDIAVGDVVYYASIDGANQAWKCDVVEGKVKTIDRNKKTVTLIGDETVYNESAVHEHSYSDDIASGVLNMSATTNMNLYMDKYGNMAAFSQNITGNFVLLTDGWSQNLRNGTEYAAVIWDRESQKLVQYDITSGGGLFIGGSVSNNSWDNIKHFVPLNCNTNDTDQVHTMLAYMESDGETAKLLPVDTIYDVQRENRYPVRMLDLEKDEIPYSLNVTGRVWGTDKGNGNPYSYKNATTTNVRALSNTTYYFVYHTTWVNDTISSTGAAVYVDEVTGYAAAKTYVTNHNADKYVEDVYAVGTVASDANKSEYYTANVVVVELNDKYYNENRPVEEIFIYDFDVTNNYYEDGRYIEEVKAIDPKTGAKTTYKIDMGISRSYTEADNKQDDHQDLYNADTFQPGLYWLHRSYQTNADDIWYINRMSHDEITATKHYDVGTVITSHVNGHGTIGSDYVWVSDWQCAAGTDHVENTDPTNPHNVGPSTVNAANNPTEIYAGNTSKNGTRNVVTNADVYYKLSYTNSGTSYYNATLDPVNAATCLVQNDGGVRDGGLNQVLVRFDGSGNVLYAVSFADGTNTDQQFAQRVWRNCLLSGDKNAVVAPTTASVKFFNVGNGEGADMTGTAADTAITVSYGTAKDFVDKNTGAATIVVTGDKITDVTATGLTFTATDATKTAWTANVAPVAGGATYTVTVVQDGKATPWTLVQKDGDNDLTLRTPDNKVVDPDVGAIYDGPEHNFRAIPLLNWHTETKTTTIEGWQFFKKGSTTPLTEAEVQANTIEDGDYAKVTVKNELGNTHVYTITFQTTARADALSVAIQTLKDTDLEVFFNGYLYYQTSAHAYADYKRDQNVGAQADIEAAISNQLENVLNAGGETWSVSVEFAASQDGGVITKDSLKSLWGKDGSKLLPKYDITLIRNGVTYGPAGSPDAGNSGAYASDLSGVPVSVVQCFADVKAMADALATKNIGTQATGYQLMRWVHTGGGFHFTSNEATNAADKEPLNTTAGNPVWNTQDPTYVLNAKVKAEIASILAANTGSYSWWTEKVGTTSRHMFECSEDSTNALWATHAYPFAVSGAHNWITGVINGVTDCDGTKMFSTIIEFYYTDEGGHLTTTGIKVPIYFTVDEGV